MIRKGSSLSLAFLTKVSMLSTEPISPSMFSTASFAPPWEGPHSAAMPAAMAEYGLVPVEPASRTVEVDAFCSWSACSMKIRSMARAITGLIT